MTEVRNFKVEIDIDEMYEMQVSIAKREFYDRGPAYFDGVPETKTFVSFADACKWVRENPSVEVLSFVRVENKLDVLKMWTKVE